MNKEDIVRCKLGIWAGRTEEGVGILLVGREQMRMMRERGQEKQNAVYWAVQHGGD